MNLIIDIIFWGVGIVMLISAIMSTLMNLNTYGSSERRYKLKKKQIKTHTNDLNKIDNTIKHGVSCPLHDKCSYVGNNVDIKC